MLLSAGSNSLEKMSNLWTLAFHKAAFYSGGGVGGQVDGGVRSDLFFIDSLVAFF